jgi:hydrogenase nickel incorporation protein HypA/HybF
VHELSLCSSIHDIVDKAAGGRSVETVHLEIGQFRQVVPHTLSYCWGIVTATSRLAGSRLSIDHVGITLRCATCEAETTPQGALSLICSSCGGGDVSMLTGEEFMITSLDLKEN